MGFFDTELFDITKKPPKAIIQFNKALFQTLIVLSILCVALGGLYATYLWAIKGLFIPFFAIIIGIPLVYIIFLKPIMYAFNQIKK